MKRRDFLKATAGAAGGMLVGCDSCRRQGTGSTNSPSRAAAQGSTPDPDVDLVLRAAPSRVQILEGSSADVWRFSARTLRGSSDAVVPRSLLL